jgi:pimeloyl-ACP methyl ester carboxylesterase
VRTYKPSTWKAEGILLHFHGLGRHPSDELGSLAHLAESSGHMLVAPWFDPNRFPFWRYQAVGIVDEESPRPREEWTGTLIVQLLRELEVLEGPGMAVRLIGHSAGGQFVERFAGFHSVGAACLIAANPASVLMPSRDYRYPYGFGDLPDGIAGDDAIAAYLRQPLVLYVGALDDQNQGTPDTRPEAMRQGGTRPQRAQFAFETGRATAEARGWDFNWRLVSRPGVGHSLSGMFGDSFGYDVVFKEMRM